MRTVVSRVVGVGRKETEGKSRELMGGKDDGTGWLAAAALGCLAVTLFLSARVRQAVTELVLPRSKTCKRRPPCSFYLIHAIFCLLFPQYLGPWAFFR